MKENEHNIDTLIGKCLAGEASVSEHQEVSTWCSLSTENQQYFDHLKTIFEKASLVRDEYSYNTDAAWMKVRASIHAKKTRWLFSYAAIRVAAGLFLVSVVGALIYQQYLKPIDHIKVVSSNLVVKDTLPDGTQIALNKQTELVAVYDFKKKKTTIKLKGEANFKIKHEAEKELIVETHEVFIRDIGTVFNIKAYPESNIIEVSVQEGEVQFFSQTDTGVFIKAGGKGIYDKLEKKFMIEEPDTNVTAYATRIFIFEDNDLETIVDQLNAIYEKKIKIADNLKACRVTVNFNNEDIQTIAEIIAETLNLKVSETENEILLNGEGCE